MSTPDDGAARWREDLTAAPQFAGRPEPVRRATYPTLDYEVDGRVARLTFNRPERGNTITADTPRDLAHAVERADLDPAVHVILLSGRGKGFCGGYDLGIYAEDGFAGEPGEQTAGTTVDPRVQAANHDPAGTWDPMRDYAMMSRFTKGFSSLLHADKPTVVKLQGFCVAGGTDMALCSDLLVIAADAKIGYPPARVWGSPTTSVWVHRIGVERAKRLLFTGDCLNGAEAVEWGLGTEAPSADALDERFEVLLERIARVPVNQLVMMKLLCNQTLLGGTRQSTQTLGTILDGITRHTPEGYGFAMKAATEGFREAVRERDEPFGDLGPSTFKG